MSNEDDAPLKSNGAAPGGGAANAALNVVEKPAAPGPPPDGGLKAWLQVVGGFFIVFNTWGLTNAFGVFQTYYSTVLLTTSTPSSISWIGSIQAFLLLFVGIVCGRALDAGYSTTWQLWAFSWSSEFYQVLLAQGLCVGIGPGCLFSPAISVVGTYFAKRSLATGIAASGGSAGGIVYPIMIRRPIAEFGFAWAVRAMGFVMLGALLAGVALIRPRLLPRKSGPLFDFAAFKDPVYTTFCIGLMLIFLAFFIPFFYSESYALNIGTDTDLSFYMLCIMNAAGLLGRLLPNAIADKVGNLNTIVPCALLSAVCVLAWISVDRTASLIIVSFFYAFVSGGVMALPPAIIVFLSPDLSKIGVRVGMVLTVGSLGVLTGSPIAGAILKSQSGVDDKRNVIVGELNFSGVLVFTGVVLLFSSLCLGLTRYLKAGVKLVIV